jgi:hypothetical protein
MKKRTFSTQIFSAIALFLLLSQVLSAQKNRFGLQLNGGASNLSASFSGSANVYSVSGTFGFSGVHEHAFGSGKLGIMLEPGLAYRSYRQRNGSDGTNLHFSCLYAQVPFLGYFNPLPSGALKVTMGLSGSYLMDENLPGDLDSFFETSRFHEAFMLSGIVGMQYAPVRNWAIGARLVRSFSPALSFIETDGNGNDLGVRDVHWVSFEGYARYYFQ